LEKIQSIDVIIESTLIISVRRLLKLENGKTILETTKDLFRYKNPKYIENEKYGRSNFKTKKYLMSYEIDEDNQLCISRGGKEKLIKHFKKFKLIPNFIDRTLVLPSVSFEHSNIVPREDQEELLDAVEVFDDASAVAYASFGKTVTYLEMIRRKRQPALVIVHTTFLQEQWIEACLDPKLFNMKKADIGGVGGVFKAKARLGKVNICLYHSLANEKHLEVYKEKVGLIFFDEGQKSPIEDVQTVTNKFRARFRYTASANLTRKDGKEVLTFDTFGPVKFIAKEQNSGSKILSRISLVKSDYYDIEYDLEKNYSAYITRASQDKDRNILICKRAIRKIREGKLVIIFVERKVQAAVIYKMLSKFRGDMLLGKFNMKDPEIVNAPSRIKEIIEDYDEDTAYKRILELAETKNIDYVVATQKAEVGLSVRTFDHGIITTPQGNNIERFNQTKGRIERTYSEKQEAFFGHLKPVPTWDVIVDKNENSREAANKVREHYGKEVVTWVKTSVDTNLIIRKKEN